jgi:putative iron-dependent peroxidase
MSEQKGILEPPQGHATLLTYDLRDASAAPDALARLWEDMTERLHDWYRAQTLTVTVGFGLPIFEKLGRTESAPDALKLMPGWEGDAFNPVDTQADLIVQICANDRSGTYHAEKAVRGHLAPAFSLRDHEVGLGLPESRGVMGFVDGTGNPKGDARIPVVLIGDDEADSGGSYLVFRKIREDLAGWEKLTVDQQEKVMGRRKADSAKLDPEREPATSHRLKSSLETEAGEIEILRRSFPFAGRDEAGLLFVCFVRDLAQYEAVKGQMTSRYTGTEDVGKDAIESFYTAVSGGYYFVPPQPDDDGYIGDFLFEG